MTDEEKSKESFNKHITEDTYYRRKAKINIYKDGYLDGLAEGRKEGLEAIKFDRLEDVMIAMVTSDCIDPCDISKVKRYILDLEKENEQLKITN